MDQEEEDSGYLSSGVCLFLFGVFFNSFLLVLPLSSTEKKEQER